MANMFGLDMIMIRVGGWDILVGKYCQCSYIGGIKIPLVLFFRYLRFLIYSYRIIII